ncbi:MAG: hypothetical protein LBT84_07290, partial [Spirochaetia bacterium]|nr:hypothetical protein [Spirochaetia bacterium]
NGSTEHWVKIQDKQKRIGWIFGAYGHVYRGGNKYETPEEELDFYYYSCKNEQEQNPAGLFLFFSFAALPLFMPRRT